MADAVSLTNRALEEIGAQATVTSVFPSDGSAAANAANILYLPAVDMVLREAGWDAGRQTAALAVAAGAAAHPAWSSVYLYPAGCVQIRQVFPSSFDPLDPLPIVWAVGIDQTLGKKIVMANIADALAVFTARPSEDEMDSILQEAVVRTLASSLAMAIAGRPDFAKSLLEQSFEISRAGMMRVG